MDYLEAIEIAPDIFWVGYVISNDPLQCHVYLIRNGNESILIDPGSMITFPVVLDKITSIIRPKDIKYIILHHQDPDIVSSVGTLENILPPGERYIITHWRTELLLKHYQWKTPFYLVDKNNWKLKAGNREIEFIFTPYAHFPGAFCTYDKKSKILFSSDLFGGLTPEFELFTKNVDEYFEYAKLFHTHYIPSNEILKYNLTRIEKLDLELIAPQHGSIVKKEHIKPLIDKLKTLDCGLYLMDDYYDDIYLLTQVDEILRKILKNALLSNSIETLMKTLFKNIKNKVNYVEAIKIITDKYIFKIDKEFEKLDKDFFISNFTINYTLYDEKENKIGNLSICFGEKIEEKDYQFIDLLFKQLNSIIGVSLKKEIIFYELKEKEHNLYEKAITDPLTGLYNRNFLIEALEKKILETRRYKFPLSIAMIDIDYFKQINDTYGHLTGDCLLQELALLLRKNFRGSDIIARYGGEEFLIIMPFTEEKNAAKKLNDFRQLIENYKFCSQQFNITISVGIEEYNKKNNLFQFIEKADKKLYQAKRNGRNKVIY